MLSTVASNEQSVRLQNPFQKIFKYQKKILEFKTVREPIKGKSENVRKNPSLLEKISDFREKNVEVKKMLGKKFKVGKCQKKILIVYKR